jgi:hypothetical protein
MDIAGPPIVDVVNPVPPVVPPPPAVEPMDLALEWIGFGIAATRERIRVEGFGTFEDLNSMKEKDIRDLAESYGRRTIGDGRFIFGIRRTKYRTLLASTGRRAWTCSMVTRLHSGPSWI